jgi:hypothetical protein
MYKMDFGTEIEKFMRFRIRTVDSDCVNLRAADDFEWWICIAMANSSFEVIFDPSIAGFWQ